MPARQVRVITQVVAEALGRPTGSVRAPTIVPDADGRVSLPLFIDHLVEAGRGEALAYLTHAVSATQFTALVESAAFPLLLLRGGGKEPVEALVLRRRKRETLHGVRVVQGGASTPVEGSVATILREWANGEESVTCLTPLPVSDEPAARLGATYARDRRATPSERLVALLRSERRDVGIVLLYAALSGVVSLTLPLGVQSIVGLLSGGLILQPVVVLISIVVLGTLLAGALQILQMSVVENLQQRLFARLSLEYAYRLPRVRIEGTLSNSLPELTNRFFELVTIQKSLAKLLMEVSTSLLTLVAGLLLLTFYHPYFSLFGLGLVLLLGVLFWLTGPGGLRTSLGESWYKYRAAHWLEGIARSITAFKFAGRSNLPVQRMDVELSGYLVNRGGHFRVLVTQSIAFVIFKTLVTGGLLVLGALLVIDRQITLGQFVASELVIVTVLAGAEKMVASLATVYDLLTAVQKSGDLSDLPDEPTGSVVIAPTESRGMAVSVRDVSYTYTGAPAPAIDGITLDIAPGEKIGITGYFGSGQTTLLRVLGTMYDGFSGGVAFDDVPLRDLDRAALRDHVGQYLSKDDLFDGTIAENVAVGRSSVPTSEVLRVLREVGLADWVQRQPDGLGTHITDGGRRLPSTIAVKLLLAQGIAGKPKLLLFDDFLGTVEADVRTQLVRTLTAPDAGWTLLAATHDAEFLRACDRILLLDDGRPHAIGTFDELVQDAHFRRVIDSTQVET